MKVKWIPVLCWTPLTFMDKNWIFILGWTTVYL